MNDFHTQADFVQISQDAVDLKFGQHLQDSGIDPNNVDPQLAAELQIHVQAQHNPDVILHQAQHDPSIGLHQSQHDPTVGLHDEQPHDDGLQQDTLVPQDEADIEGDGEVDGDMDGDMDEDLDISLDVDGIAPFSPRRGFTHKRNEDPPRNEAGKMMCKFQSTCAGVTFDRRCEWSKHMDKHERPYKCQQAGCEKLQGFTYSGGLLRHQREVHKMHGGTKKALYCPEPNCKRNSGSGFTRKENLSEHIRRVHRRQTDGTPMDPNSLAPMARMSADGLEQLEAAARENFEDITDPATILKRKREELGLPLEDHPPEVEDLREEVKRLKTDVTDRDSRLSSLEEQLKHQAVLIQQLINAQAATKM